MNNNSRYTIPKKEMTVEDIQSIWKNVAQFQIRSKYGYVINSEDFTDKITLYNKKNVGGINQFVNKRTTNTKDFIDEIIGNSSNESG